MSFRNFMKENKIKKENVTYAATKSLIDESGNPLLWEIKPLTTRENDNIRDECTSEVPVQGKQGMFRPKLDTSKYIAKMICSSVISPNLYDAELQNSYGVMTPEDLLKEMIDDPGEYGDFATFIQNLNGFITLDEKIETAKN